MNPSRCAKISAAALTVLGLLSLLAGCSSGNRGGVPPTPTAGTAVPTSSIGQGLSAIPPIHSISLGSYKTALVLPGKEGILLAPATPPSFAGIPSLAFYRYDTQQVEQIATAPPPTDGSPSGTFGIAGFGGAGDWVGYDTMNEQRAHWTLWAYNTVTRERVVIDSEAREGPGILWGGVSGWRISATDLVWSLVRVTDGHFSGRLFDYSFATRQTQTLYATPTLGVTPVALSDSAILLVQGDASGDSSHASTWLLERGQSAPRQISTQISGNAALNARYAVWDDTRSQTLTLYDLTTGQESRHWPSCIRPAMDQTRPYVVCLQFHEYTDLLVPLPNGQPLEFAKGFGLVEPKISDGRVVWPEIAAGSTGTSTVHYFDLPTPQGPQATRGSTHRP